MQKDYFDGSSKCFLHQTRTTKLSGGGNNIVKRPQNAHPDQSMHTKSVVPSSIDDIIIESLLITSTIESDVSTMEGLSYVRKFPMKLRFALA